MGVVPLAAEGSGEVYDMGPRVCCANPSGGSMHQLVYLVMKRWWGGLVTIDFCVFSFSFPSSASVHVCECVCLIV